MTQQQNIRVMAATPCYTGQVVVPFLQSYVDTHMHLAAHGIQMRLEVAAHFSLVQFARNYLLTKFLEDGTYTHLLWLDSDLGWDPTAVYRMLQRGKDVIAGVYPLKQAAPVYPYLAEGANEDGIQLAERIPTGFMMMNYSAVERVADTVRKHGLLHNGKRWMCPNVFDLVQEGEDYWGEDFVLCKRLRKLGIDIYVERDIDFAHVGMHAFGGNVAKAAAASVPAPIASSAA